MNNNIRSGNYSAAVGPEVSHPGGTEASCAATRVAAKQASAGVKMFPNANVDKNCEIFTSVE